MKNITSFLSINRFWKNTIPLFLFLLFIIYSISGQTVVQYTTAGNHTFYVPFGVTQVTVECWGGGGAGGGATSNEQGSAGGGGGAYARKVVTVTPCTYYSISVGAGGTTSTGVGGTGGTTRFGANDVVAVGGTGGGTNNGGTPGVGGNAVSCIGNVVFSGGNGASANGGTSGGGGGAGGSNGAGGNASGITGGTGATVGGGNGANGRSNDGGGHTGSTLGGGGSGGRKERSHIGNFWSPSNENGGAGAAGGVKITYTLNACNSMPNGGSAQINISQGCSGTPFTISANCYSINSGITYQWQSSPNGVNTWTNISGATNPNTYSTSVTNTTYYRLAVTCSATGQTAYSSATHFDAIPCISMPNGTNSITTCAANFYDSGGTGGNYSNSENRTYTFYPSIQGNKIRVSFSSFSTENNYDGMMIYNGNSTAAPLISSGLGAGSNATTCPAGSWRGTSSPGTVTSTAVDGSLTFVFRSDASTTSSGWISQVSCAPPCAGMPNGGVTLSSMTVGCQGYSANLSVSSSSSNSDVGITYQWQSSPTASGPWSNIAGATGVTYTASVNSTIYYRRLMICIFSGESDGSAPIQLNTVVCSGYNMPDGQTINTCAAYFYDSGGPSGNYGNSQNRTTTFCADSGHVRIDFSSFNLEGGYDFLYVYDGPTTGSPLAYQLSGTGSGSNMPPVIISTGQCITFRFTSNGSTNRAGWAATVSCTQDANTVARNFCGSAPHICNLNGYTGVTSSFYLPNTPGNMCGSCGLFDGSLENNSWISFTATGTSAEFDVEVFNCSDNYGIQLGVYSGVNCNNFSLVSNIVHTSVNQGSILANNTTTTITVPSASAPPLVPGQTYYIMIDGYGGDVCNYSIEAISGIFVADLNINDTVVCEGEPVTFIASGGIDYIWSTGDVGSSITVVPSVSTTYMVTVSGGNPLCPDNYILSAFVEVQPAPTASITGTSLICEGDSAVLTASGGLIYDWSTGQTSASIIVNPTSPTDYTVTVTSGLVCTSTATHYIDISPSPTVTNVTITDDNCNTNSGEISFTYTGGTPPVSINWNTTPVSSDTIISNLPAGSYTLTLTDSNSCSFTATYQIISIAGPTISNSSITNASCNQTNGGVNIVINSTQNLTYLWSTTPTQTSQNLSGVPAGQYTVTVTDEYGCTVTGTYTVGNTSGPTISNFNITQPSCGNSNGSISITTTGGAAPISYSWNTTPPQTTPTISGLAPGSYTVVVTDGSGCTISGTYSLQDIAAPQITQVTKVDETCSASNGSATVIYSGGTAPVSIIWTTSPPQNTPSVNNLPAGSYTVTIRDANNCTATQTIEIVDFPSPIIDGFTSQNEMCDEQNGTIEVNYTGGTAPIQFVWNTNPVQNSQTATDLVGGDYSVTITDVNGCSAIGFWSIINHPKPTNEFTNIYMDTCIVGVGKVSAFPSGGSGIYSYVWNTIPTQNSQSATGLFPGIYTVIINDGFCTITDSIEIIGIPGPDAAFVTTPSLVTMRNPTVRFEDISNGNVVTWDWFFGDGFHSNMENPAHIYQNTGDYNVVMIITDANGCIDTARGTVIVDIDFGIWIPNAFTPNEDGKNERFGPKAVGFIEKGYSMKIFDRWGKLVFETTDYYTQWDGRDKYSGMQRDVLATYVYEIIIIDNLQKMHRFYGKISAIY